MPFLTVPRWVLSFKGETADFDDRILVVQYDNPYVPENNKAVMWKKWRLVKGNELYDLSTDPGQQNDIAEQHPEVVRKLEDYYNRWLEDALKGYNQTRYIYIGTEHENPCMLYSSDWQGSYADNVGNLFAGECHRLVGRDGGNGRTYDFFFQVAHGFGHDTHG